MTEKSLLLLRHAKSSWDDPELDDFDRPLARRGHDAAPLMAAEMMRLGWVPDAALVSSATRTRQTWALIHERLGRDVPATFDPNIYEASAERILAAIRATDPDRSALLVVGHNPGLEDLSVRIASPQSNSDALDRLRAKFPTTALARFSFEGSWDELSNARLDAFLRPRDLV